MIPNTTTRTSRANPVTSVESDAENHPPSFRSGFVTFVGRPNVGKSTLINQILGTKVSIVSDKVQTTRTQVRGIYNRPDSQIVFVDTPGIHRPRSLLGERSNEAATSSIGDVDVVCVVLDATMPLGKGDRFVAARAPRSALLVVNKIDQASRDDVLAMLRQSGAFDFAEYFPVSAATGAGVDVLTEAIVSRMPEGPAYYPTDVLADVDETFWVAELVREQLLHITSEELPHSIACRVTEWEEREGRGPYVRVEVLVERDSQKPIVIGKGGNVLKAVGVAVREQLPAGSYLDIHVKVDREWQRRPKSLDRLGY